MFQQKKIQILIYAMLPWMVVAGGVARTAGPQEAELYHQEASRARCV